MRDTCRFPPAAFLIAAVIANVGVARADVDLTGNWDFTVSPPGSPGSTVSIVIDQTGTALTIYLASPPPGTGVINPATGVFSFSHYDFPCGMSVFNGAAAPDGNSMSGSGTLAFFVPTGGGGCLSVPVTFTGIRVASLCGNAAIDTGETCDDGNRLANDCCSPFCSLDAAGTPCITVDLCTTSACDSGGTCTVSGPVDCDDGRPCTMDACDAVLGCVHLPDVRSCRSAQTSKLLVSTGDTGVALTWKWLKGESTSAAEFADPRATATYNFCLFAGTAPAVIDAEVEIPPDAQEWTASGDRGFKFKNATGDAGGVRRIILRASDSDRAKVVVKARHAAVSAPPLAAPVTAQLTNRDTNVCWSATWAGAEITLNESGRLKAKTAP